MDWLPSDNGVLGYIIVTTSNMLFLINEIMCTQHRPEAAHKSWSR